MADRMKFGFVWLFALVPLLADSDALSAVHTVYLMPMSHGFDQYMANQLTGRHIFEVVTDPKLADAFFTEKLGAGFEQQLNEMRPPPAPPKPAPKPEKDKDKDKDKDTKDAGEEPARETFASKDSSTPVMPSFTRSKGTVFLVDARSRRVLWSVYDQPKNTSAGQLEHTAGHVVDRLKKDLTGK